jgi:phosphonate transport system substrate-binding protein
MAIPSIKFTSCQAPSADRFCAAIVQLIGRRLGVRTEFVNNVPWSERERGFDEGAIEVCWMCGWPYAERADSRSADFHLLAARVMGDSRYLDQPIYFSDLVVRADSPFQAFDDLRGGSWAYNEPKSHSGYNAVRYLLAKQNGDGRFFRSVIESGSHAASIDRILTGELDGAAVDSTVLDSIRQNDPERASLLRVIGTIGPSPAPPWVMRSTLSPALRHALRNEFLAMHEHPGGRAILEAAGVKRFGAVTNEDYDPIREMAAAGATIQL